jgi:hypothetical protein
VRLSGADRIETAIRISQATFADRPQAGTSAFVSAHDQLRTAGAVVLARSTDYADALAGTPLAVEVGAPVLLTPTRPLDDRVLAEIQRILPPGGTVHLLGGRAALDSDVSDRLRDAGFQVNRISGQTRVHTSIAIARVLNRNLLMVTTGYNFPDALSAGAAAAARDAAVLLTTSEQPHSAVTAYLAEAPGRTVYAVGGPAARAYPAATPVFGATREHTAVRVAETFFDNPVHVGLSRRDDYPDALAGGAHIGRLGGPILLTMPSSLHQATAAYVCANHTTITTAFVYGGTVAVQDGTAGALAAAVEGRTCPAA